MDVGAKGPARRFESIPLVEIHPSSFPDMHEHGRASFLFAVDCEGEISHGTEKNTWPFVAQKVLFQLIIQTVASCPAWRHAVGNQDGQGCIGQGRELPFSTVAWTVQEWNRFSRSSNPSDEGL